MKQHTSLLADEAVMTQTIQQLGAFLFVSLDVRQQWQEAVVQLWPSLALPAAVEHVLLQTQDYGGVSENWWVLARHDAHGAVSFIDACVRRILPEGIRWSVAQPEEVLDVDTLFIEANQQLRSQGQQFYQLQVESGMLIPVLVQDIEGFAVLMAHLGIRYDNFNAGRPILSDYSSGYGVKQMTFWVLYVALVLWGVYHFALWLFHWFWHWFD